MHASFIDALRDHQSRLYCDSLTQRDCGLCTTVSGISCDTGETFWLQFLGGSLNFQHLPPAEKEAILAEIMGEAKGLEPGKVQLENGLYVTFDVDALPGPVVDRLLMRLLSDYHPAEEASVKIATERIR